MLLSIEALMQVAQYFKPYLLILLVEHKDFMYITHEG